jgi:tetratricopeptide (TPR) repeat protein/tRNA A-37 threonylcarbamoyl transferase component Bud32
VPTTTLQTQLTDEVAERYAVERELARGGMAIVYVGHDRRHDRRVAIKVLDPALASSIDAERFHREIGLLARLQHPHVLPLHDSGTVAGSLYYVMPLVEGGSLRERLRRERTLPTDDALRIAEQVADALAYAHARGIVHRDVKPDNILLSGYDATQAAGGGSWHALVCDFGIARLTTQRDADAAPLDATTGSRHTVLGTALGTPTYMAPEQASGDGAVDGRADVWALGMVLYEMLAGAVPFEDEATPHAALVRRLTGTPDSIGRRRRDLSRRVVRALDAVIARATQPDPALRYQSADELLRALQACRATIARGGAPAWSTGRSVAVGVAATALAVGAAAWNGGGPTRTGGAPLDASLYAVLPFAAATPAPSTDGALDGRSAGLLLVDAMSRWSDLRQVSTTRVHDVIARAGGQPPQSLEQALALARRLGAGRLVWGSVATRGERTVVRAALYDVATPDATPREHRVEVRAALPDLDRKFGALADSLLLGSARSRTALRGALSTTSWNAWRAYDRGHEALSRWDLAAAERAFADAAELDPEYAHAHLWRAQALAWTIGPPPQLWRLAATRAVAQGARLQPGELLAARAVQALAEGRHPDACALYRQLVARDSLDFAAWYGLGDCQARDSLVVADAASPSGWRFRANYEGAIAAYQRALSSLPSVHRAFGGSVVSYLPSLLVANGNQLRVGYAARGRDTLLMGAYPSLVGDSLAFVPWPLADVAAVRPHTMPRSAAAATARNRRMLLAIAQGWAAAFPRSAETTELVATALETLGRLDGPGGALETLRRARALGVRPETRTRVELAEVRVLLKLGRFDEARRACDALLARAPATPAEAADLAIAAALTGRASRAAALARTAAAGDDARPELRALSPALLGAARAHEVYAADGQVADSVLALRAQVDRLLAAEVPPERRGAMRQALLAPVLGLAVPVLGARAMRDVDPRGDYLLELAAAAARGDTAFVRRRFVSLAAARQALRPTDLSLDAIFVEGWLHAWAGDTAAAIATLDGALESLSGYGTYMIGDVSQAAALGRAIALRAELAARGGDPARATRWAAALLALRGAEAGGGSVPSRPAR